MSAAIPLRLGANRVEVPVPEALWAYDFCPDESIMHLQPFSFGVLFDVDDDDASAAIVERLSPLLLTNCVYRRFLVNGLVRQYSATAKGARRSVRRAFDALHPTEDEIAIRSAAWSDVARRFGFPTPDLRTLNEVPPLLAPSQTNPAVMRDARELILAIKHDRTRDRVTQRWLRLQQYALSSLERAAGVCGAADILRGEGRIRRSVSIAVISRVLELIEPPLPYEPTPHEERIHLAGIHHKHGFQWIARMIEHFPGSYYSAIEKGDFEIREAGLWRA